MNIRITCFLIFIQLVASIKIKSPVYTSQIKLDVLVKEEVRLIKALDRFIKAEEKNDKVVPNELKIILNKTKLASMQSMNDTHYTENPINAFHLLYRMSKDWKEVFDVILCDHCEITGSTRDFKTSLEIAEKYVGKWPSENDATGSALTLVKLWIVYDLDLVGLFDGKIQTTLTNPLSPTDIFFIARTVNDVTMHYEAILWLELLEKRILSGFYDTEDNMEVNVVRSLAGSYNRLGFPWKSLEMLERLVQKDPENFKLKRDIEFYRMRMEGVSDSERSRKLTKPKKTWPNTMKNFEALCRGNIKTEKEISRLRCYYRQLHIPILRVQEEVFNIRPRVVMIHNIISDEEISLLRNLSDQSELLLHTDDPLLERLDNRTRSISRYLVDRTMSRHLNNLQLNIQNTGFGDAIDPKTFDYSPIYGTLHNDRDLTWMYQLNDVISGGAIVFDKIKTRVPPIKGSAVFWYHIKNNGKRDYRTVHAQCPVLLGTKWHTDKGISSFGTQPLKCWKY